MFLIILLLAITIILTVGSIVGAVYFFYRKKIKLGIISLGAFAALVLLIVFLCYFYAFRAPGYPQHKHGQSVEYEIEE